MGEGLGLPFPLGFELLQAMPATLGYAVLGLVILGLISSAGFVLARLGYRPLWAILLVIPLLQVVAYWALAYSKWPRQDKT